MATFKFTGTITISRVRSKREAIRTLQVMLNDYEDMNPDFKDVLIEWDKVTKEED